MNNYLEDKTSDNVVGVIRGSEEPDRQSQPRSPIKNKNFLKITPKNVNTAFIVIIELEWLTEVAGM